MTDEELEAIETARFNLLNMISLADVPSPKAEWLAGFMTQDIPALIAEVKRLRLESKNWERFTEVKP